MEVEGVLEGLDVVLAPRLEREDWVHLEHEVARLCMRAAVSGADIKLAGGGTTRWGRRKSGRARWRRRRRRRPGRKTGGVRWTWMATAGCEPRSFRSRQPPSRSR
eukprot:729394-Rhodomonas_salina.1